MKTPKKQRMTATVIAGTALLGSAALLAPSCQTQPEAPNVILVITDDQGYGDLARHGNEIIQTPNLDDLHDASFRFTSFHVGTTCAPTRAGLMTGRNCNRNGVWHTIGGASILNQDETTLPEVFAANGYTTGMFGKWHLGDAYPFRPHDRGFDEALYHGGGGVTQTPDYWKNDYFDDTYFRNGEPEQTEGYCTDVWFEEALHFIKENREEPFFCYISTNAPHAPFNVPEEYYNLYREADLYDYQKRFYGMITNVDDNVGRLRQELKTMGLEENTLFIFMTDNGTAAGYKPRGEEMLGYNAGMRGTKGSPYEGGHRVPFFMHWPARDITGGREIDALAAHVDILPTLAELCNLEYTPRKAMDGQSLAGVITGKEVADTTRMLITDTQRIQWPEKGRKSCVMQGPWRLMLGKELYHIGRDPGQTNDVADQYPEKVAEMQAFYDAWWTEIEPEMEYSYMEVGTPQDPVIITGHDVHAPNGTIPWNQAGIRRASYPGLGYLCVEVKEAGEYTIELARWPFESNLAISDTPPAIEGSETRSGYPAGVRKTFQTASVKLREGPSWSAEVDNSLRSVTIPCTLPAGKHRVECTFTGAGGNKTGAYYIRITKKE